MGEGQGATLRKMVRPPVSAAGAGTDLGAWRMSLPRASEEAAALIASVRDVEQAQVTPEDILEGWDEMSLAFVLSDAPGGLAILDQPALTALIEVLMTGGLKDKGPAPRRPTGLDAALVAPVVDAWLEGAHRERGTGPKLTVARMIAGVRAVKLHLVAGTYRKRTIAIRFGDAGREGALTLLEREVPVAGKRSGGEEAARRIVHAAETRLHVVLHRCSVSVDWLTGLEIGSHLEIPAEALTQVRLESEEGRLVARGRLGQLRGRKALKLVHDAAPTRGAARAELEPPVVAEARPPRPAPEAEPERPGLPGLETRQGDAPAGE